MRSRLFVVSMLVSLCAWIAYAQYTSASLGGTVLDPGGAAIPQASVKAENMDTGLLQTTTDWTTTS